MSMNLQEIWAKLRHTDRRASQKNRESRTVERDWRIMIIATLIVNGLIILGSLYLFWNANSAGVDTNDGTTTGTVKFNQGELDMLESQWNDRAGAFDSISSSTGNTPDPSK